MRPDDNAINILSTTRATAKMHEFRVAPEDFIALPRNPAMLFALAVGLLGDVAATVANMPEGDAAALRELPVPRGWGETGPSPIDGLRFASVFFDAFLNARLDDTITTEFSLLCASSYYLAGNPGSAAVIIRHMDAPQLQLAGGLGRLVHAILANAFAPIDGEHVHADHTVAILTALGGYMRFESDACDSSRCVRGAAVGRLCERVASRVALCRSRLGHLREQAAQCGTHAVAGRFRPCIPTYGGPRSPSHISRSSFGLPSSVSPPPACCAARRRLSRCRPVLARPALPR